MSKLHKNYDHALERIDKYMHGQNSNDNKTHISSYRYKQNIRYCYDDSSHVKHFEIKVKRNIGRFDIMNIIQNQDFNTYFDEIPKINDKFGPAFSTHLFLVKLAVPRQWVIDDPDCEIHFIWETQCEASIYCPKTGKHLQAFSDSSRDIYHIKVGPKDTRNDLMDSNLVIQEDNECVIVSYLVELACQEMFGCFASWGGEVDMEKQFIFKKCEIGLFNYKIDKYYYNIEMIRDAAKLLEKDQSTRAHRYLNFIYDCANKYLMPLSDQELDAAIIESDEFIQNNKNASNQFKIYAVGHCHIDTAWLWPYRETKRKIARSWSTQLEYIHNLFKDRGFKFCASSAAHYWWLKQYYPELYGRLKQAVNEGTFEIVGGTWVEFDGNIPSGESMTRQFLYGQHFFEEEFGKKPKVFFLPDTFGYSPQLPQIAKNAEIEYFLTQKISWNFWNQFPHHTFYWKGIDGSSILSHFPPADTYVGNGSVKEVLRNVEKLKDKGRTECALYLFGDGDGGGGPQLKHVERLIRVKDFDGIPKVEFSTCHEFFEEAKATQNKLMSWEGELYLELHNGTYTNMSEHKYYNRFMEIMFRDMEFFYYFAEIAFNNSIKPQTSHQNIKDMWHVFLIDQFHDVLPGTCTFLTVEDTRQNFKELNEQSLKISQNSIKKLLQLFCNHSVNRITRLRPQFDQLEFDPSTESVIILNTLNYDRKDMITCQNQNEIFQGYCFTPQVGLASFTKEFLQNSLSSDNITLEQLQNSTIILNNKFYEAVVCQQRGQIISLKDKRTKNYQRQVVQTNEVLNKLVIHDDVPFYWDNWDIMHHTYETKQRLVQNSIISFSIKEQSQQRIILSFQFKISDKSSLFQDIIFNSDTSRIDFKTQVDWYESKKLLKAYFPVDIRTDYATFEIGSGTIRRAIHENTSWDQARLEVCGHKFIDLSESQYGVSLLNDCKYGFTVRNQTIGITLLKSGEFPWVKTDKMTHRFIYSILCHDKPLIQSDVFEESYKLNTPLWAAIVQKQEGQTENPLNPQNFFEMIDSPNCIVSAFKQSEKADKKYIMRICEQRGEQCMATIKFNKNIFGFKHAQICNGLENILENSLANIQFDKDSQTLKIHMQAFKISSILLQ